MLLKVRRVRTYLLAGYDFMAWVLSFTAMAWLQRVAEYGPPTPLLPVVLWGVACGGAFVLLGIPFRIHQGRASLGSFTDALFANLLGGSVALTALALNLLMGSPVRISVMVTAPICAFVAIMGIRAAYRLLRDWRRVHARGEQPTREPVVVIGAGDGADQLVEAMLCDPACPWQPVALLDDDPYKRHRRLYGVPVRGTTRQLAEVAERHAATTAILAIPSASSTMVRDFNRAANRAGLELKVLPSVNDLSNPAQVQIEDVRDIEVTDFLGRKPIETDVDTIANYLTGKRVLVTGAGGSIGSELCRQIARFGPAELIMLDRDESALHAVQLSIQGRALLDSNDTELGDIRDARYVRELFARRAPHVVFHAAALKHLPLLEAAPGEAVKTNVWGTQAVIEASIDAGVERFVNVSTDKAANPCSVLGYTKRLAEGLTSAAAKQADGSFMSVRFGNVLGSRGSVLTTFTSQIARGGPVTVTDAGVTRYFMTIREAVQLVIQAGALGSGGEVLVLDMGEPIAIQAVAEQLIEMSGKPIEIVHTGLREGEKMHEELLGDDEVDVRPQHPLITHAPVPEYAPALAQRLSAYDAPSEITRELARACAAMGRRSTTVETVLEEQDFGVAELLDSLPGRRS